MYYAHSVSNDYCVNGLLDGIKASGLEEGKKLEIVRADAQAEMINIPAILQNYDSSDVDLIMTISTPCLAGARNSIRHKRVVFTWVSDPIVAGVGRSLATRPSSAAHFRVDTFAYGSGWRSRSTGFAPRQTRGRLMQIGA